MERIREWWRRLGNLQKFLIGGIVLIFIIISLIFMPATREEEKYVTLYSELSLQEAGEVIKNLKEKHIPYKLVEGGTKILVPETQVHETRIDLAVKGIPKGGVVGYEIFDKGGLGVTAFVEEVNYKRALEGELVRTIRSMSEVSDARVHLVLPKERLFKEDQKPPTASVLLRLKSPLTEFQIKGIAHLIASSVEGLESQNVTVLDYSGDILWGGMVNEDEGSSTILSSLQLQIKRDVERYLAQKAQSLLEKAVGINNAIVRVNADINFMNVVETREEYNPEGQVIRSEEHHSGGVGDQSSSVTNYEISKTVKQIVSKAGTINRLSASALVNGTYELLEKGGKKTYRYIPRSEEEIIKFRELVKNAIGYNEVRGDMVEVTSAPFGAPPLPIEKIEERPPLISLLPIGPIIGGILGIVALILIIRFVSSILRPPKPIEEVPTPVPEEERVEEMRKAIGKRAAEHPETFAVIIRRLLKRE